MQINRSMVLFVILGAAFISLTMAIGPFGSSTESSVDDDPPSDQDNWAIKIDQSTFNSRDFSIGDEITSFAKETFIITASDGETREKSLCPNLPLIEMTNRIAVAAGRFNEITLEYDADDCSISVHDRSTITNRPSLSPNIARASYDEVVYGRGLAETKALDGIGFGLTQTRTYLNVNADTLEVLGYVKNCDWESPAGLFLGWSITWHNPDCRKASVREGSNYVEGKVEGDYYATFGGNVTYDGDTEHTSTAKLKITTTNSTLTCVWDPGDIEDFVVIVDPPGNLYYEIGLQLRCANETFWDD